MFIICITCSYSSRAIRIASALDDAIVRIELYMTVHRRIEATDLNGRMHFLYNSSSHYGVVECRREEYELVKNMSKAIDSTDP